MIIAFIIWSVCCAVFIVIGIIDWRSKKPVGFFTGVKPPEVTDTIKYNRAVAKLWFVVAILFEILGIPFLFAKQNSPVYILTLVGTVFCMLGLAIGYTFIESKYRVKKR
ncbi:MAG: hypothetical protein K6G45_09995 [Lachnospiraceae bacterium]|nr:hypothetical protein [Lachnospiraceae bacterium]